MASAAGKGNVKPFVLFYRMLEILENNIVDVSRFIVIVNYDTCSIQRVETIKCSFYRVRRCGSSRFGPSALEMGEGMENCGILHFPLLLTHPNNLFS